MDTDLDRILAAGDGDLAEDYASVIARNAHRELSIHTRIRIIKY